MWNIAQNFFVDSSLFYAESFISVPKVDFYFKSKPSATNNQSGITNPGVSVIIVSTTNHIPNLQDVSNLQSYIARLSYTDVKPSNDASLKTTCVFNIPILLAVGEEYSILVKFDGDENFVLWEDVTGAPLVGSLNISANGSIGNTKSTSVSTGPSCKYVGPLYHGSSLPPVTNQGNSGTNIITTPGSQATTPIILPDSTNWTPELNACLKFCVYYNRYNSNGQSVLVNANTTVNTTVGSVQNVSNITISPGVAVSNTTPSVATFTVPSRQMEYVSYDASNSSTYFPTTGDRVWQEQPHWKGGDGNAANSGAPYTISVTQGNSTIVAKGNTDFTKLFSGGPDSEYIVVHAQNQFGTNTSAIVAAKVLSFNSSIMTTDANMSFSNSGAFYYKSTVATLVSHTIDVFSGNNRNLLWLGDSNANSSLRMTSHTIYNSNIAFGGTGFSNTDFMKVTGYEDVAGVVAGGYAALANVQTNTSGGLTALYFSNAGAGFTNTANLTTQFFTSSNIASSGSGATITHTVDAVYRSQSYDPYANALVKFRSANLLNLPVDKVRPSLSIVQPDAASYTATHSIRYYQKPANTDFGKAFFAYTNAPSYSVQDKTVRTPPLQYTPCMPSRSNEHKILTDAGANSINSSGNSIPYFYGSSNSGVTTINSVSTSDNTAIVVSPPGSLVTFYKYFVNNDYTLENTNYGNAISKQIENKVTLANNRFAEDMLVFLTCYRPVGTDFKIYSRFYNSADPDAFDEKDWTLLHDAPQNSGLYSAPSITINNIELDYIVGSSPNTDFTCAGSANVTSSGFSNLAGQGTTWSSNLTANVQVNDLVKFYQPLFPNQFMISVVTNVHSDTLVTIADPITNNQFLTTPLNVDVIRTYKYQAFLNQLNDNIIRYYNQNMTPLDTYNVWQMKMVFLSVTGNTAANTSEYLPEVPYFDDVEVVAVSA